MGWVEDVTGHIVGLDTAPLIYYVEAHPTYLPLVEPFFAVLERGDVHGITSIVTLIETTIRPMRNGNADLVARYKDLLLGTANIDTIDLSAPIAQEAARLRSSYNLRTPDAIQLATAVHAGATAFLTNDERLADVPELNILVLDTLHPGSGG